MQCCAGPGYAPLPIELNAAGPTILAVGGHLKNTIALGIASRPMQVVLSSHVGDLDSVAASRFSAARLTTWWIFSSDARGGGLRLAPRLCLDLHAEQLAARWNVPLRRVQHHHAHVAACMAEHRLAGPVLGLAWDGTGYGCDGTIWGGEALLCRGAEFRPHCPLADFSLPGGDLAMRQPRRSALGMLYEILGDAAAEQARATADWFSPAELRCSWRRLGRSVNCPRTSSMGRLFDAVAALCGLPRVISFEGQAAMSLEFAADGQIEEAYPLPLGEGTPAVADWEPMLRAVLTDRAAGVPLGRISARSQCPGGAGPGRSPACGRDAGGPQWRMFPKCPLGRPRPPTTVAGRLFRVHSSSCPTWRWRHRPGPGLGRRPTNIRIVPCVWAFPAA